MTWLRRCWLVAGALLLCACGDDQAGADATDTATDTDVGSATGTADPSTTTSPTEPATSNDDDETTTEPTTSDPSTTAPTSDASSSSTTSGATETSDTNGGEDSTVFVSVDHGASPPSLMVIVAETAAAERQCDLAPTANYDSIVFTRDNELLGHNTSTDRLERIDACDCGFQAIGPTDLGTVEMTVDAEDGLIGLDVGLDAFVTVNPATGLGNIIGPLGVEVDDGAIAWSDATAAAHVLDATGDQLYTVDTTTGALTGAVALGTDITDPGLDVIGDAQTMYMCAGTTLYTLDTTNGAIAAVGALAFTGACTTLAAPREAIDCLEP